MCVCMPVRMYIVRTILKQQIHCKRKKFRDIFTQRIKKSTIPAYLCVEKFDLQGIT